MKQTHARVGNLPNKCATQDKIEPLGFQKVGPKSEQLRVTLLGHLIMPSRIGKCQFNMCYCIQKDKVIIVLETSDKCKND